MSSQKVLIFGEQRGGKIKTASLEMTAAFAKAGYDTSVILQGSNVKDCASAFESHGASQVFVVDHIDLQNYCAETYTPYVVETAKKIAAQWVVAAHSPMGKDLMPRVAARLQSGLASDCTAIEITATGLKAKRPLFAGKVIARVEFLGNGPHCLTIRPNTFGASQAIKGAQRAMEDLSHQSRAVRAKTTDILQGALTRPDVTEASIVVSGGRSLKSAENFSILEQLADVLGAGVGASRAAVDAGYRPHRDQVGQTGKVVSPALYIAFGISGAIQHLAGMRTSKTIVAVNLDPEAPIFQVADYGVVADLFQFVPFFKTELQKLKDSQ